MQTSTDASREDRLFGLALLGLLILAFLTGGSAQISGWDDTAVQLLALPVLAWALWRLGRLPACTMRKVALAIAALVALVPLLQLLPLPESVWRLPEARRELAADLAAVGVTPDLRWSLAPLATERAFLFLLSPLALFCGTLAAGSRLHWPLLRLVMLLAMTSLLLAFVQLGVPAESPLIPFPQWAHQFNGVFANANHQGIALVVGTVIALAGMLSSWRHVEEGRRQAWTPWVLGFVAIFFLCALPLTGSRGAILIAGLVVGLVPVAGGLFARNRLRTSLRARIVLAACIVLLLAGAWVAIGWVQADTVDAVRAALRSATLDLGNRHAPLGTGMGAFVAAFEQGAPDVLLRRYFVNHAHNDYLQWWMEAGWLGVAVPASSLAALATAAVVAFRREPAHKVLVAAVLGLAALLLHSLVDYPLRTTSLATVAAILCGVLVARAAMKQERTGTTVPMSPV